VIGNGLAAVVIAKWERVFGTEPVDPAIAEATEVAPEAP
jgi:hypothetical protein